VSLYDRFLMPNRLVHERSPYLLQHAHNPVDWYPWGAEAFDKARQEGKPIFLSVGYSTCHWCHVMERESFEDEAIARLLNEHFVPVKVDREERPDVDRVYMAFIQATTGSGGWPMSVWLTPDLQPFFGGTYFPPESRWGRTGFTSVLVRIGEAWRTERARIEAMAHDVMEQLRTAVGNAGGPGAAVADAASLVEGVEQFRAAFDTRHGGFGEAPKFPRPSELLFLLGEHARTGDTGAREMAVETLRAMARGGIHDHGGGGFHRYAVDEAWRVPHFEKMLYDQAQLVLAYLEAAQATGDGFYSAVAEDTLEYVQRDLTDPDGGFYSAEDADSVPPERVGEAGAHRSEGAFYAWRDAEVGAFAGADADVVRLRFGVEPTGNVPHDPQGEFVGKNLLYVARAIDDVASRTGRSSHEVVAALERGRQALFTARARRPRPPLDDKVLTAWNGLMIAAFARAGRVLPGERAARSLEAAQRAAGFIRAHMWDATSRSLHRCYRDGRAAIDGYAEDYAFLIWGLLELFQTDGDPAWLEWGLSLQARQDELFLDEACGGWFSTTGQDPSVLLRLREDYDGAEPAASSVATLNQLALWHLTGDAGAATSAERALGRMGPQLGRRARTAPLMARALSAWHAGVTQVVLVGDPDRADYLALRDELAGTWLPFGIVVPVTPGKQRGLSQCLPWIASMTQRDGRATAYVCRDFACQEPVTRREDLRAVLKAEH
jgi:uncharacterized protein YyaL (SSP411 family)